MLSSHALLQRPVLVSRFRVSNREIPIRSSLILHSYPYPSSSSSRSSSSSSLRNNGKIWCFRHQEFGPKKPDFSRQLSPDESLLKPEIDKSTHVIKDDEDDEEKSESKSFLSQAANALLKAIGSKWTVPWTAETILQVMLLWVASFWFIGSWMIPFVAHIVGFNKDTLTFRGQALFSLVTDVTEGIAGIAILRHCLSKYRPFPSDWFKFSWRGNWHIDVILGCLMFPLVNRLSHVNLNMFPIMPSGPVTLSSVEQSIMARDPVAMGLYAIVVAGCAPLWEEIVFRGFLLPSLTKYMPVWCAILVSSVAFALAHFNIQRILPLIFLGVVMGVVFTRSRNLLPSMLLHSLWNAFVFIDLMR
ncbi:hypothetical protein ACFE04_012334 [Oxalis oulophora]